VLGYNLEMWVKEPPPLVKGGPTYIQRERESAREREGEILEMF